VRNLDVYPTALDVAAAVAEQFAQLAAEAIRERQRFTVAFAGGSTPRLLYEHLAEHYATTIAWEYVYAFWGDERFVPPDHADSNYRIVQETLLEHVAIPPQQIFPIPTDGDPHDAAARYQASLADVFGVSPDYTFDLVLLGMGDDGHTASLFPYSEAIQAHEAWVVAQNVDKNKGWRITLTPPVLTLARCIKIVVTGKSKAARLREVITGIHDPQRLPIQSIIPVHGERHWIVDRAASTELE
jgi:6-phosphogluconolactonase